MNYISLSIISTIYIFQQILPDAISQKRNTKRKRNVPWLIMPWMSHRQWSCACASASAFPFWSNFPFYYYYLLSFTTITNISIYKYTTTC